MELPVTLQLRELGWALALGAGLGLLYELLRPLRRGPWITGIADLLYCLTVFLSLMAFALYAGRGRLRLFAPAAMALSGGLCLAGLGALRRRVKKYWRKRKKQLHLPKNLIQ